MKNVFLFLLDDYRIDGYYQASLGVYETDYNEMF